MRNALLASAAVHLALFGALGGAIVTQVVPIKRELIVDYIKLKDEPRTAPAAVRERAPSPARETPRINVTKQPVTAPQRTPAPVAPAVKPAPAPSLAQNEALARQMESRSDYVSYYQVLREEIRRRLKENYVNSSREGDVYLVFTLRADGSLLSCECDHARSTTDTTLITTAIISIKEAAPFTPFPPTLRAPSLPFTLTVSFKKR